MLFKRMSHIVVVVDQTANAAEGSGNKKSSSRRTGGSRAGR